MSKFEVLATVIILLVSLLMLGAIRGRGGIKCIFRHFGADLSQVQS